MAFFTKCSFLRICGFALNNFDNAERIGAERNGHGLSTKTTNKKDDDK
ncbi:hypothetical protein B4102_4226 [Heyndrickxia sporothermodurans]|uniref:Uncharacterized protein n=1 Tax=Heyndrickxia sporothermodurans TaxID=46224 RepID=A0A150KJF4_9BACI|nr:hypothetical protein B4102_4226 [Heyndrickxia sporothermodurans]